MTVQNALKRLPELYFQDFAVREVLRLPAEEEAWLLECWGPSQRDNNPIFGRLDAVIDFTSPMWKNSLRFMEPNMSGIGGLYLVPTAERVIADLVLPRLAAQDAQLQLELPPDIRERLWPFLGTSAPVNVGARGRDEILADLLRSNDSIVLNLKELRRRGGTGS